MTGWFEGGHIQRLRELWREMWVRVTLFSLSGVALAFLASWAEPYLPYVPEIELASGSVDSLLNIVASSMLAVTTFSMSIIVGAYGAATTNATPRATRLLAADPVAQNAVSIFIGSFLFSIVGIIGLSSGLYAGQARTLLFVAALLDVFLIAWALLRWVDQLNSFGRMSDVIARIEQAASASAQLYNERPALGAVPVAREPAPEGALILSGRSGYVRFIDMAGLQALAEKHDLRVTLLRMPGKYVHIDEPLLSLSRPVDDKAVAKLRDEIDIGPARSFDQDLRYGMIVLSEVASKALSAAVNDPGTAVEVLRAGSRVLEVLHRPRSEPPAPRYDRITAPIFPTADLYREFYAPVVRDGAGLAEVMQTMLDGLEMLERRGDAASARKLAADARARAERETQQDWERALL